jgi:hypothetical protein
MNMQTHKTCKHTYLKRINKKGVAHAFNSSTWEAERGGRGTGGRKKKKH